MRLWNLTDVVGDPVVMEAGVRVAPGGSAILRGNGLRNFRRQYPASTYAFGASPPAWYRRKKAHVEPAAKVEDASVEAPKKKSSKRRKKKSD